MSSPSLLEDSVVRRPPVELLYEGGAGRSGPGVNLPERGEVRPGDQVVHLGVEDCSEELLRQQSYGDLYARAGSLWHKGAYNRTFPCMEANYPYAIKNQRRASRIPPN